MAGILSNLFSAPRFGDWRGQQEVPDEPLLRALFASRWGPTNPGLPGRTNLSMGDMLMAPRYAAPPVNVPQPVTQAPPKVPHEIARRVAGPAQATAATPPVLMGPYDQDLIHEVPGQGALAQAEAPQGAPAQPQAPATGPNNGALYDGLIQAGAGMLSGKDFQQGMARGVSGFNEGYDQRVDKDKAEARPKVIPLADGAFTLLAYPDGTQKMVPNAEVQKYTQDTALQLQKARLDQMGYKAEADQRRDEAKDGRKVANAAEGDLQNVNKHLEQIATARETLPRLGLGSQLANGVPGGGAASSLFAPQVAIDNQRRQAVKVLDWVNSSTELKGALSNVEGAKLDKPLPGNLASKEEWSAYFDNSEKIARAAQSYLQKKTQLAQRSATAPAPAAPAGGAPDLSALAQSSWGAYEPNKFDYRVGPNGNLQRKPK